MGKKINIWTQKSIDLANQRNYLDLLYKIYPMSINLRRELSKNSMRLITFHFNHKNAVELLKELLKQEIFPIKDSYVAYLKRDKTAIKRNPATVERLSGILYEMGLNEIFEKTTAPKETNRQIGPLFKSWIDSKALGCEVTDSEKEFMSYSGNIIFSSSDERMKLLAQKYLGYKRDKGLDFIGKFNNQFVIGEAKFLTDFGGHQNAQFQDAITTMRYEKTKTDYLVHVISILDGVLYIKGRSKMHRMITNEFTKDEIIISVVLLRDYLYSL